MKSILVRFGLLVVPIVGCIVLAVLITFGLGLRQLIRSGVSRNHLPSHRSEARFHNRPAREPDQAEPLETIHNGASVGEPKSSLPVSAARTFGRHLPAILRVGDENDMFATIEEALHFAISGDVIEICTNRPMVVSAATYLGSDPEKRDSLTIRAGAQYSPVLQCGRQSLHGHDMFRFSNTHVTMENLHFAALDDAHSRMFYFENGGKLLVKSCTFSLGKTFNGARHIICVGNPIFGGHVDCVFEQCFLRGSCCTICGVSWGSSFVTLKNCMIVSDGSATFGFGRSPGANRLILSNNTLLVHNCLVWTCEQSITDHGSLGVTAEKNILSAFQVLAYCDPHNPDIRVELGRRFIWQGSNNVFVPDDERYPNFSLVYGYLLERPITDVPFTLSAWREFWGTAGSETQSYVAEQPIPVGIPWESFGERMPSDFSPWQSNACLRLDGQTAGCNVSILPIPPITSRSDYDPFPRFVLLEGETLQPRNSSLGASARSTQKHLELQFDDSVTQGSQWVEFEVLCPKTGTWQLELFPLVGPRAGIVRCSVNGQLASADVDLYAEQEGLPTAINLGPHNLSSGEVILRVECAGKDPAIIEPGAQFALDYLSLRRIK